MDKLLFGAAYYDEYMPYERLEKDVDMLKRAGMNVVRIAESTWSTCEPQPGVFDFTHAERVMDAMEKAGISVIVGTPTYAVPTWMVKQHPGVQMETEQYPVVIRRGINDAGKRVMFCLNYTADAKTLRVPAGKELIDNRKIECDQEIALEPWGVAIVEEA